MWKGFPSDPGDVPVSYTHLGFNEAVQFFFGFRFRRLHHQGARNGEGHGGAGEAVVHEPFGNFIHREAGVMSELTRIQNAFMRHQPLVAGAKEDKSKNLVLKKSFFSLE